MRIELRTARYLDAVAKLLLRPQPEDALELVKPYLTDRCPECGEHIVGVMDDGTHTWVASGLDASTGEGPSTYVVVGCEGYFVINPEVLGLRKMQWQDWTGRDVEVDTFDPISSPDDLSSRQRTLEDVAREYPGSVTFT